MPEFVRPEQTDPRIPERYIRALLSHGVEPDPELLDALVEILADDRHYWILRVINTVRENARAAEASGRSQKVVRAKFDLVGVIRKTFQVSAGMNPGARKRRHPAIPLQQLWERDGGICQLGSHPVELADASRDHIKPLAEGGKNRRSNIQLSCRPCNELKGSEVAADV